MQRNLPNRATQTGIKRKYVMSHGTHHNQGQASQVATHTPAARGRRAGGFFLYAEDEPLLSQLTPAYAEILRQHGDMKAIATRLNLPIGTVKSRLHRARARLEKLRAAGQANPEPPHH